MVKIKETLNVIDKEFEGKILDCKNICATKVKINDMTLNFKQMSDLLMIKFD